MVRKQVVTFVDDLDGSEAEGTVQFTLDTNAYEIDLSQANQTKLREALSPFLEAGRRKQSQPLSRAKAANPRSTQSRQELQHIRAWAKENGYPVNERGRIPNGILEAYQSGTPSPTAGAQGKALKLLSTGSMSSEGPAKATMLSDSEFTRWAQRVLEEESELPQDDISAVDFTRLRTDLKAKA
ncbi:Lsr2 family protein [Nocardiopsis sp. NPDC006938]|uniref:histone-like nucleoid-structuring protein Lsr2 n=1 Tax=Nocardiopsis sp. NPDC006938 TaxID=3364337 RepID=UPI0036872598